MDLDTNSAHPLWIEKVGRISGRDHLGLESVGQTMLEELSSGISNITRRLRYFSLYAWIIKSFFDSTQEKSYSNYRLYLNKISFLYMLSNSSVHLEESVTGIDGIDFARKNLSAILSKGMIIDDAYFLASQNDDQYRNNNWIYKAKLSDLNISVQNDDSLIPSLIEPFGKELAEAFELILDPINPATLPFEEIDQQNLEKLEKQWCYHRLTENEKERKLLEDILFSRHFTQQHHLNRRYTLILLLQFIKECKTSNLQEFEYWIYEPLTLSDELDRIKYGWKLLFARNYFVFSLESLFLYFLRQLEYKPVTFVEVSQQIMNTVKEHSGEKVGYQIVADNFHTSLQSVIQKLFKNEQISVEHELHELKLITTLFSQKNRVTTDKEYLYFINSLLCLLSLYWRYHANPEKDFSDEEKWYLDLGDTSRLSLTTFFTIIEKNIEQGKTLIQFIDSLYQIYILPRHQLVAAEKLYGERIDTFHFYFEDNTYISTPRSRTFEPTFNAMKIEQMVNFFEDLGLVNKVNENTEITNRGEEVLKEFYE